MYCSICGKNQDSTKSHVVYTARNLGETSLFFGVGIDVTAHYGEFEPHNFNVCRSCSIKHNYIYPLLALLISVPIIMLLGIGEIGGALFFALIPSGFVFWKLNVTNTLIRMAISARRRSSSNAAVKTNRLMSDFKGYSSFAYLALMQRSRPSHKR